MNKETLDKLYELLSTNGSELAFVLANGLGYTDEELMDMIWDKYSVIIDKDHTELYLGAFMLENDRRNRLCQWWINGSIETNRANSRKEHMKLLIKYLKQ